MQQHYFAADGNYGDANGLVVVDTSAWTEDEWALIDDAPESERAAIAAQLSQGNSDQLELPLG